MQHQLQPLLCLRPAAATAAVHRGANNLRHMKDLSAAKGVLLKQQERQTLEGFDIASPSQE